MKAEQRPGMGCPPPTPTSGALRGVPRFGILLGVIWKVTPQSLDESLQPDPDRNVSVFNVSRAFN